MGKFIIWLTFMIFLAVLAIIFSLSFNPWGYVWCAITYGGIFLVIIYRTIKK